MITLQYYNGTEWVHVGTYPNENFAWITLGGDNVDYRTLDADGNVLTDKSLVKPNDNG